MDHFNQLTPAELERLAILSEECSEVIQIVGKILRHGYESYHPNDPTRSNRNLLEKELGDLSLILNMMEHANDFDGVRVDDAELQKRMSIEKYLHHNNWILKEI